MTREEAYRYLKESGEIDVVRDRAPEKYKRLVEEFEGKGVLLEPEGRIKYISKPAEQRWDSLIPDVKDDKGNIVEGKKIDLRRPEIRTFTPDINKVSGKPNVFDPKYEALAESAAEAISSIMRSTGVPFVMEKLTGKNVVQDVTGLTPQEEEEIPLVQKLGASAPVDLAVGEAATGLIGKGAKALAGTKTGQKIINSRLVQGAKEVLTRPIGKVSRETVEEVAPETALATTSDNVIAPSIDDQKRALAMQMEEKLGFRPAMNEANVNAPMLTDDASKAVIKQTGDDIAAKSGTGVGNVSNANIVDPAFAGGSPTQKMAVNVNLEQINAPEDVRGFVQQLVSNNEDAMKMAKRGVVSRDMAAKKAQELGISADDLTKRQDWQGWNSAEMEALRPVVEQKARSTWELAGLAAKDPSLLPQYLKEATETLAMQSAYAGGKSETARALRFARSIEPAAKLREKAIKEIFGNITSEKDLMRAADMMSKIDPTDTVALNQFLQSMQKPNRWRQMQEVMINGMLGNIKSNVRNVIGNTLALVSTPVEKTTAGVLSQARRLAGKQPERFVGEGPRFIYGTAAGIKDGMRVFAKSLATGQQQIGELAKFAVSEPRVPAIPGKLGEAIRVPTRIMQATDDFFKAVIYRGSLHSNAYREGVKKGLKGKALEDFIVDVVANPSAKFGRSALAEAEYRTFTQKMGPMAQKFSNAINQTPLKVVQPFMNTPINIAKYSLERTPLNIPRIAGKAALKAKDLAVGEVEDALSRAAIGTVATTGLGLGGLSVMQDVKDRKVSRPAETKNQEKDVLQTTGMLLSGGLAQLWAEGQITGAPPQDPEQRKLFYASGKIPYAIKIGDTWRPYGIEPVGTTLGLMSDMFNLWDQIEGEDAANAIGAMVVGQAINFTEKSFMQGLSNLMEAWADPETKGSKLVAQTAFNLVPFSSAIRTAGAVTDDYMRKPTGVTETFMSNVPYKREQLPMVYDIWGKPIEMRGSPLERATSPLIASKASNDKATLEAQRLGASPGSIKKYVGEIEIGTRVYDLAQRLRGERAYQRISKIIGTPSYDRLTDFEKKERLEDEFRSAGSYARQQLGVIANSRKVRKVMRQLEIAKSGGDQATVQEKEQRLRDIEKKDIIDIRGFE